MATTKKYELYLLHAEYGEVQEEYWNYRDAFSKYQRSNGPATLYGIAEDGTISVIYSKGERS